MYNSLKELNKPLPPPIKNLENGEFYKYDGQKGPFSNSFIFEIIEDEGDHYIIKIENSFESVLTKDFELLESFDSGLIHKVEGKWSKD